MISTALGDATARFSFPSPSPQIAVPPALRITDAHDRQPPIAAILTSPLHGLTATGRADHAVAALSVLPRRATERIGPGRYSLIVAAVVFALAGCGGQSELEQASMEAQLAAAESRLAAAVSSTPADLAPATRGLIEVVAEWREELGDEKADGWLRDAASTVNGVCLPCLEDVNAALDQ